MRFWMGLLVGVLLATGGVAAWRYWPRKLAAETQEIKELPLLKYTIENLARRRDWGSAIELGEIEATESATSAGGQGYVVQKFYFDSDGKKVSGLVHVPDACVKCPVIAQFRGYYDREKYYPGAGTRRTAVEFAKAGFISLAPDFLGYGESASPSADVWEARFETYTTAVNLLAAIDKWPKADGRVGIWGHSNGGHIALTVLEITGRNYPTVLWAPVSAPFPYAVLYYTDDYEDHGQTIRKDLARFEADYDTEQFALVNYLDKIAAPILWQQGTADPDVPIKWSRGTVGRLRGLNKEVEYAEYPGADHNLAPNWSQAVAADIKFFENNW